MNRLGEVNLSGIFAQLWAAVGMLDFATGHWICGIAAVVFTLLNMKLA